MEKTEQEISSLEIMGTIDSLKADHALKQICLNVAYALEVKEPGDELLERIAATLTLP